MEYSDINALTREIIGAAIEVHRRMGPGLCENVYEECLMCEFAHRGIQAERQVDVELIYRGQSLKSPYIIDILVEGEVILELKAVRELAPVHTAQILSYLRLADKEIGYLINFHESILKNGIRRYVNTTA